MIGDAEGVGVAIEIVEFKGVAICASPHCAEILRMIPVLVVHWSQGCHIDPEIGVRRGDRCLDGGTARG